jgi:hypothetical protein
VVRDACAGTGLERSLLDNREKEWTGSPLDMAAGEMDPYGIREVVVEFENGDSDTFRPRRRDEFGSYEIHQMAAYLDAITLSIREGHKR